METAINFVDTGKRSHDEEEEEEDPAPDRFV
jgi:hypothetical protein